LNFFVIVSLLVSVITGALNSILVMEPLVTVIIVSIVLLEIRIVVPLAVFFLRQELVALAHDTLIESFIRQHCGPD
jgi:energy-converting hydrogenase Eha subunit C